jgi:predicted lipoprotein with Yx(FWY)xxD motif
MPRQSKIFFALGLSLMVLLAACGSNSNNANGGYDYGSATNTPGTAPTTTTGGTGNVAKIATASVTVKGAAKMVLTDAATGKTLYYFANDTATTSSCTGGCSTTWPPETTSGQPTATTTLSGMLGIITGNGSMQASYNGHPLYHYTGDTSPGQANGEGIGGVWHVATPDLSVQGSGGNAGGGY